MMGGMSYIPNAWKRKVKQLYRRLKGSTMPKLNKRFAYQTMVSVSTTADRLEEKAERLHGDTRKQALEAAKYFRELAKEIAELL